MDDSKDLQAGVDPSDPAADTIDSPSATDATQAHSGPRETSSAQPTNIGPYNLIQKLGEGGMGQVWLAQQVTPVKRQVALKLIKGGWYDPGIIQRFESERQTLAIMDHPAIAKVFDAGATREGQPYFVMEYVAGEFITDYCDSHKLTIRERLDLFIKTCEGVQHAHQKAIVHRDLKPSNILVAEVDGKPTPRIIDFGIAKAVSPNSADAETVLTSVGSLVGTPDYMSPEQADRSNIDIDTRTDVYSLGVILYKLLSGSLPFAEKPNQSVDDKLRQLREVDPPTPSSRVSKTTGQSTSSSHGTLVQAQGVAPKQLISELRGDLDWITMKALEKDRDRRYGSPSELAADLGRYLQNEPIVARPASTGYRLRKYVRRHRVGVAIASGMVVLFATFAVMQAVQLRRITRERDRANRITDFMTGMFKVSDPSEARGNDIRAREILDKASTQIDTGLAGDPQLQAQLMAVMGDVYESLGLYPQAETLERRAIDIRTRVLGARSPETLACMNSLAGILYDENKDPEAEKLARETLDTRRAVLGPEHPDTLASMNQLGAVIVDEGRYPDAEKNARDTLQIAHRTLPPQDKITLTATTILAISLAYQDKLADSESAFRDVFEMDKIAFGPDDPKTLKAANNLASTLIREHKTTDAEALLRQTVAGRVRILGPEHPDTLMSEGNLALVLKGEERYPEAEKLFRDTLAAKRKQLGPEHRSTLVTLGNLADTLSLEGKYAEAEALFRQALEIETRTLGRDHSDTLTVMALLGEALGEDGKFPEAEKTLLEAITIRRRVLGPDHPDTAESLQELGALYAHEGKRDLAFTTLRSAVDHGLAADGDRLLATEQDLASLHGDPRFAALIADANQHAAQPTK